MSWDNQEVETQKACLDQDLESSTHPSQRRWPAPSHSGAGQKVAANLASGRFIPDFAMLAKPLIRPSEKNPAFRWT